GSIASLVRAWLRSTGLIRMKRARSLQTWPTGLLGRHTGCRSRSTLCHYADWHDRKRSVLHTRKQAHVAMRSSGSPMTRVRWSICAMLFFATSISYVDRQEFSIPAPTLQPSTGWTEAQYVYIVGAFQFDYAYGLVVA